MCNGPARGSRGNGFFEPGQKPSPTTPTVSIGFLPPNRKVWFARGSACVGRAYKGLEAAVIAEERQKSLQESVDWAFQAGEDARLEVRGSCERGEVSSGKASQLSSTRSKAVVRFFLHSGLAAEQCSGLPQLPQWIFQGVEVRCLRRLRVNGDFVDERFEGQERSSRLVDKNSFEVVAKELVGKQRCLVLEVGVGTAQNGASIAKSRCATLQRELMSRGVRQSAICVRTRVGLPEKAVFLVSSVISADVLV